VPRPGGVTGRVLRLKQRSRNAHFNRITNSPTFISLGVSHEYAYFSRWQRYKINERRNNPHLRRPTFRRRLFPPANGTAHVLPFPKSFSLGTFSFFHIKWFRHASTFYESGIAVKSVDNYFFFRFTVNKQLHVLKKESVLIWNSDWEFIIIIGNHKNFDWYDQNFFLSIFKTEIFSNER